MHACSFTFKFGDNVAYTRYTSIKKNIFMTLSMILLNILE